MYNNHNKNTTNWHIQGDSEGVSDILSEKCHINLGPILNINRVTFVFGFFLNFNFKVNYKLHNLNAFIVTKTN
jgi:hypothetical protein